MAVLSAKAGLDGSSLDSVLDELSWRLSDLSPALERAGSYMLGSVLANFSAQGRPESWQPVAPETAKRKGHSLILYDTGRLMSSIFYSVWPDTLAVSAPVPYARPQQEGGGYLPARPFLLFQDGDVDTVKRIIEAYLSGGREEALV
jgi:phage gpG-like protein